MALKMRYLESVRHFEQRSKSAVDKKREEREELAQMIADKVSAILMKALKGME